MWFKLEASRQIAFEIEGGEVARCSIHFKPHRSSLREIIGFPWKGLCVCGGGGGGGNGLGMMRRGAFQLMTELKALSFLLGICI